MKLIKITGILALVALLSTALAADGTDTVTASGTKPAASVSVQLMTAANTPADFGTAYSIGQLNSSTYSYGPGFFIKVTYANVGSSVAVAFSGSQTNYDLAYSYQPSGAGTTADVAFGTVGTVNTTGSATDTYVKGTGSTAFTGFDVSTSATTFKIGARSTDAAAVDLSTTVTITVTVN